MSGLDWFPTLVAAAGDPNITAKLLKGHQAGTRTFKVHLDGYDHFPTCWAGSRKARATGSSTSTTTAIVALRYENWKIVFEEQRAQGTLRIWA